MTGSFVNNAVAPVGHRPGNARRQEGLSQPRAADEQQVSCIGCKGRRIPAADVQRPLHNGTGAGAVFGVNGVGVIVQPELAEGFPAAGQNGNFFFLLLTAQFAQAFAHGSAHIAAAAAFVADGAFVQEAFLKIRRGQRRTLPLQAQIFLPRLFQQRLTVGTLQKGRLGGLRHSAPQKHVDFPDAGDFCVGFCQMLPVFRLPVFLRLGKTRPGALNHFRTVSHELSLLQYFLNGFQLRFAQLAGGTLRDVRLPVAGADVLGAVEALLLPALQNLVHVRPV